jgi:bifunctional pyridoxal-dependent enzyme with beta-cystathionase and maltose regulon repressor activities
MFQNHSINFDLLKKRAYNLRWATVPEGVIPLTAADPDFKSAPEIAEAIASYAKDRYFCYTPPEGLPEFKESIATYFHQKRNVPVRPKFAFPMDSAAYGIFL